MSGIQSLLSNLFTNPISQTNTSSASNKANNTSPPSGSGYSEAFELDISQTTRSDGSQSDSISFATYSAGAAGGSSGTYNKGSGGSIGSAFEQLLASLQGGDAGTDDSTAARSSTGSGNTLLQTLDSVLTALEKDLSSAISGASQTAGSGAAATASAAASDAAGANAVNPQDTGSDSLKHLFRPHHHHHSPIQKVQADSASSATAAQAGTGVNAASAAAADSPGTVAASSAVNITGTLS